VCDREVDNQWAVAMGEVEHGIPNFARGQMSRHLLVRVWDAGAARNVSEGVCQPSMDDLIRGSFGTCNPVVAKRVHGQAAVLTRSSVGILQTSGRTQAKEEAKECRKDIKRKLL
jgi:hypothetical protein